MLSFACRRQIQCFAHKPTRLLHGSAVCMTRASSRIFGRLPRSCREDRYWCSPNKALSWCQFHSSSKVWKGASSTSKSRLQQEGFDTNIGASVHEEVIKRAQSVWPPPSVIPNGWSASWGEWPHLLTFYWFSPYFLMLPQIEMVVNIAHRIPGETRPILFSTEKERFLFTLVQDPTRFFVYNVEKQELSEIKGAKDENALAKKMTKDWRGLETEIVPVDPEGMKAIERIMNRDVSVIPVLAEKFLDYTPTPTLSGEEGLLSGKLELTEEDLRQLEQLVQDLEKQQKQEIKEMKDTRS